MFHVKQWEMGISSVDEADRPILCYGRRLAVDDLAFDAFFLGKWLALVAGQISGGFDLSVRVGELVGAVPAYFAIRSFNRSQLSINLA
jgi:hypothetical protein